MAGVDDLYSLCNEYLEACATAVATAPAGAITRRYVSPGPPAFDCCPQLTVHAGNVLEGNTLPSAPALIAGARARLTGAVVLVPMTATVLRCTAIVEQSGQTPVLPSASALNQSGYETLGDVWAIWHTVRAEYKAGTLFASPAGTREVFFDPAVPVLTAGGCAGWSVPIKVQLGGY